MEKSNLMMIVIIVLLVALLGTIVGVTFYAFRMMQTINTEQVGPGFVRDARPLHIDEISNIMIGDAIVTNLVNPAGGASNHIARVQVVVGYDNTQGDESDAAHELITENISAIRMLALDKIGGSTVQELSTPDARRNLADTILEALQNDFRTNMIVSVGFYEWIIN